MNKRFAPLVAVCLVVSLLALPASAKAQVSRAALLEQIQTLMQMVIALQAQIAEIQRYEAAQAEEAGTVQLDPLPEMPPAPSVPKHQSSVLTATPWEEPGYRGLELSHEGPSVVHIERIVVAASSAEDERKLTFNGLGLLERRPNEPREWIGRGRATVCFLRPVEGLQESDSAGGYCDNQSAWTLLSGNSYRLSFNGINLRVVKVEAIDVSTGERLFYDAK